MRPLFLYLGLLALALLPVGAAEAQGRPYGSSVGSGFYPQARVWLEGGRDTYRHGDRLEIAIETSRDAYVALLHIDSEGHLEFLFPASPWEEAFVRGGRVYTLPRGFHRGWTVRGQGGIGYLYLIASPVPLDYSYFVGRAGWDWSHRGRFVRGDPFFALEQITRLLVPGWPYAPHVVDYFSYHIGGRHRYPAYACADYDLDAYHGWGRSPYLGACDRLDLFLRDHPYYYDARRFRGDRREFFRDFDDFEPRHEFKAPADRVPPARGWDRATPRRDGGSVGERDEPARREQEPVRRRPTLERRGTTGGESTPSTRVVPRSRRPRGGGGASALI